MNVFRCGYCGTPTDKEGNPLSIEDCNKIKNEDIENAELVHGFCCVEEQSNNYIVVTKDMAIDAQDLSLEGEVWKW